MLIVFFLQSFKQYLTNQIWSLPTGYVANGTSAYSYDANGNMTGDGNRGAVLTYNYLNLPKTVTVGGKTLTYDYDAAGTKHKYVADTLTLKYAGAFQYRQSGSANDLYRVGLSEGQAVYHGSVLKFEYYIKDHLGNVRVVFDDAGKTLQRSDYYPFGMSINRDGVSQAAQNGTNKNLYNSKELQAGTGYLDYGARMYMPEIGRWGVMDGMSEQNHNLTGYSYAVNNPALFIDPLGLDTLNANTDQRVVQGDVINFGKGVTAVQSADEAVVTGQGYNTLAIINLPGNGIGTNITGYSSYPITKGADDRFVDPFLLTIDMIYSLNLSGANNGDPNVKGGSGPGAALSRIVTPTSNLWKVGKYNEIRGVELGLDAHHVGQGSVMEDLISGYNYNTAPAILVPKAGHTIGTGVVSRSTRGFNSVRQVIARDIFELRRVYPNIPNSSLQELIQLNKTMYPSYFTK